MAGMGVYCGPSPTVSRCTPLGRKSYRGARRQKSRDASQPTFAGEYHADHETASYRADLARLLPARALGLRAAGGCAEIAGADPANRTGDGAGVVSARQGPSGGTWSTDHLRERSTGSAE